MGYKNNYNNLINKDIAIIQYPKGNLNLSEGKIKKLTHYTEYEFAHNSSTEKGSSGSPIFLKGTTKVIGIHKWSGGPSSALENYGDFLWPILSYFKNYHEEKENKNNNNIEKEYNLIEQIGNGSFPEIFLASKEGSPIKYAIKKYDKDKLSKDVLKKYLDFEKNILKDINHPNIVKIIEIKDFEIVMEYCNGGNLDVFIEKYMKKNHKPLAEEIVQYIMRQILNAMKYLHNKNIMHRNISLKKFLIHYDNKDDLNNNNISKAKIKISDFALSQQLKKGTPYTMSPILINKIMNFKGFKHFGYDIKEDIWSLGTVCYKLLIGEDIFESKNLDELFQKINKGDYLVPITLSKEAISFLNCMLQFESQRRFTSEQLCIHEFLKKNIIEFHNIDINQLKNIKIIDNSKILINTKANYWIWYNFGDGNNAKFDYYVND